MGRRALLAGQVDVVYRVVPDVASIRIGRIRFPPIYAPSCFT